MKMKLLYTIKISMRATDVDCIVIMIAMDINIFIVKENLTLTIDCNFNSD
jgi:hypothetical protein